VSTATTQQRYIPVGPRRGAEAALQLTRALINLATSGQRPHCSDPEKHPFWLSENPAERKRAARWCGGCPVISECREVGKHQSFGVFGGKDFTKRQVTKKAAAS
jgi:hypothetical protein